MIQETGILRLLMLPAAIESHFLHQADVSDKILIRGGSQYSVAPIPLIQHELEIVWIIAVSYTHLLPQPASKVTDITAAKTIADIFLAIFIPPCDFCNTIPF